MFAVAIFGLVAATSSLGQQTPATARPWTLTDAQVREIVGRVRAGRDLTPRSWPNGARVAVGLSFDVDNETSTLRDSGTSPALLSQGEYGSRAGLPRVLALLRTHGIAASFFVPAVSAMLHQASVKAIMEPGHHEIGLDGSRVDRAAHHDAGRGVFNLESGIRRRVRGAWIVHPDDAPARHRPSSADRHARQARDVHEVEAGRVVRDARTDRASCQRRAPVNSSFMIHDS